MVEPKSQPLWSECATLQQALQHGLEEGEYRSLTQFLGHEPSLLELGIASAAFSEHCSYKTTKKHLRGFPTTGERVLQGPGENAGVIDAGDGLAVVFKIESHNHPSFIEPFHGAATGVGGILRDVFTMGARPIALMNALRFGDPALAKTKQLLSRAVQGIGFYGNCMGVPTVRGQLSFHSSFNGNCLVNAFALGVAKHDAIFYGRASGIGNKVLYIGSKTGRDGIHGASMASESFEEDSASKLPSVQVGDPFYEKLLLEACLEIFQKGLAVGVQDMGAAGMTSSSFEMASRSGTGMRLFLEAVPMREDHMTPYDIMLSESQERMLFVVEPGHVQSIVEICSRWQLDAVEIGEVIEERKIQLFWNGELAANIPVELVDLPGELDRPYEILDTNITAGGSSQFQTRNLASDWVQLISHPEHASRRPLFEQYDSTVRADTLLHPGHDSGVVRLRLSETQPLDRGVAVSVDCNSGYCAVNAYQGSLHAVYEGARNLIASGAEPVAISDCLNFASPKVKTQMGVLVESIRGLKDACVSLSLPVVSGNVSLYNQTLDTPIRPTPMVATVGLVSNIKEITPSAFQKVGSKVYVLGRLPEVAEIYGSDIVEIVLGRERSSVPALDLSEELKMFQFLKRTRALLQSCHDVSSGGLAVAMTEALFPAYQVGFGLSLNATSQCAALLDNVHNLYAFLFAESYPRYLISVDSSDSEQFDAMIKEYGILCAATGHVEKHGKLELFGEKYPAGKIEDGFRNGLNEVLHL